MGKHGLLTVDNLKCYLFSIFRFLYIFIETIRYSELYYVHSAMQPCTKWRFFLQSNICYF